MKKRILRISLALTVIVALCMGTTATASSPYDTKLVLENKDASWNEINGDGIKGVLWFGSSSYEFKYQFFAKGLAADTDYSLIYYADPWPGDNGAVIANFTSNGSGRIPKWQTGSVELYTSLPCALDDNYPTGAKIWLVPTSFLTAGDMPMLGWNRAAMLFERNLITYTDTSPLVRADDAFDVGVRFGFDSTRYIGGALAGSIEASGEYNNAQYMLYIPAGCVVEGSRGRVNWMWLASIEGDTLSFALGGGDATFSEPCILYLATGGRIWQDRATGEWIGAGEWVEVGSFTSITAGKATLE